MAQPHPYTSPLATLHESLEDGVLRITLQRPEAANAIQADQRDRLITVLALADRDPNVRAIVLAAAGKQFCSGADVSLIAGVAQAGEGMKRIRDGAQKLVSAVLDCAKPIVAQVQGAAAGLGAHLAFAADMVVAAEEAVFIEAFVLRGITVDAAGAYLLPRRIGLQKAKELVFLGDKLPAAEAERLGLVNRVVPADQLASVTQALAGRLAAGATTAIGFAKMQLNRSLDADRADLFLVEALAQEVTSKSEDAAEGIRAFKERRAPTFTGR